MLHNDACPEIRVNPQNFDVHVDGVLAMCEPRQDRAFEPTLHVQMSQLPSRDSPGAARVGIGGPVGSGKTALIEQLIPVLDQRGVKLAVVTNDLVTKEDAERLRRSGLIDPSRVKAVESGPAPTP